MKLIQRVSVTGLRSIQNAELDTLGDLTVLVGRNSAGKSNVLRALNLFFNGEVEPGRGVDLSRDHHARPNAKKKKQIAVEIDFALPATFKFRPGLDALEKVLGKGFRISKTWETANQQVVSTTRLFDQSGAEIPAGEDHARQFLGLVRYRYIPNRTVPSALLREESRAIASSIFAKMTGGKGVKGVLKELDTAANRLLQAASDSMTRTGAPLDGPGIATPESLADMISVVGFQAKGQHGELVRDELWGAGNQAFFLYEVLKAVDTNFSRSFGWKQAAIWGVEEAESGLHRDLETRLADEFRTWALEPSTRLQILQTTHSPVFTMASDRGFWIELQGGSTHITSSPISSLVKDAERRGVSSWVQPVLAFPTQPIVLVEGPIDADILTHVATLMGHNQVLFFALPDLDPAEKKGGKDGIQTYLKRHGGLIPNRPSSAPLGILLDWEVSDQDLSQTQKAYGANGAKRVARMDSTHCDPLMSTDFAGIERFYPPSVVDAGAMAGAFLVAGGGTKPYSIAKSQYGPAKHDLKTRVLAVGNTADIPALCSVVTDAMALLK